MVAPSSSKKYASKVLKLLVRDTRINDLKKEMQNKGYFMLDSSYIRPSDPNTMRNLGQARNMVWNYEIGSNYNTTSSAITKSSKATESARSFKSSVLIMPRNYQTNVKKNDYTKNIS